jgi:hypothetical protein
MKQVSLLFSALLWVLSVTATPTDTFDNPTLLSINDEGTDIILFGEKADCIKHQRDIISPTLTCKYSNGTLLFFLEDDETTLEVKVMDVTGKLWSGIITPLNPYLPLTTELGTFHIECISNQGVLYSGEFAIE